MNAPLHVVEKELRIVVKHVVDGAGNVHEMRIVAEGALLAQAMKRPARIVELGNGVVEVRLGNGQSEPGNGFTLVDVLAQIALR